MNAKVFVIILVALSVVTIIINSTFYIGNKQEKIVVIKKLEIKPYKDDSKYLVFTENNGIFEITDSIIYMRFDSSDMFNKFEIGRKYKITTYGKRVRLFSIYKNILKAEKIQ